MRCDAKLEDAFAADVASHAVALREKLVVANATHAAELQEKLVVVADAHAAELQEKLADVAAAHAAELEELSATAAISNSYLEVGLSASVDYEKKIADLTTKLSKIMKKEEEERAGRKFAENSVIVLQGQMDGLQAEITKLKKDKAGSSATPADYEKKIADALVSVAAAEKKLEDALVSAATDYEKKLQAALASRSAVHDLCLDDIVRKRINILASKCKLKRYEVAEVVVLQLLEVNGPSREDILGL